jgi:N utilization substance protein A
MTIKNSSSMEIVYVIETIAQQKDISVDSVVEAMEEGLRMTTRKKYGHDLAIECKLNRKTGDILVYNKLEIVDKESDIEGGFNPKKHITLNDAKKQIDKGKVTPIGEVKVGSFVALELPNLELSRLAVQIASNEIIRKIKEAERDKEYNEFIDRAGTIINGVIKKIGIVNIVVEVDGFETLLTKNGLIPGERFRVGDRVRAYVKEVNKEQKGAQVFLSRTDNMFLAELFRQEVPEIYDGVIEIRGIARDPGSKAKIAVFSANETSDVVGACVGIRGVRVQAVTNELKGERIDVIKWSDDPIEYIIRAIAPAKPTKVVYDEYENSADIVLTPDQLSLAIGRGGQNVRLASKITGIKLDVMTEEDERKKRKEEFDRSTKELVRILDVEEIIAQLLVTKDFDSVETITESNIEILSKIEGFNEDIAKEIYNRAVEYVENNSNNSNNNDDGSNNGE